MLMFFFVILFLIAFIAIINILSSSHRNIYLSMACFSLVIFFSGLSIYYLKVGGFSHAQRMLYISGPVNVKGLEKLPLGFERLSLIVIIGRLSFCFFYLMEALRANYRTRLLIRRWPLVMLIPLLPVLAILITSLPYVFKRVFIYRFQAQACFAYAVDAVILLYLLSGMVLVVSEYFKIQIMYLKRRFRARAISYILLGLQYLMFALFEPVTVYQNYSSIRIPTLFTFYSIKNRQGNWTLFLLFFLASTLILIVQSIKYFHFDFDEKKKELVIEERINGAALSSSILIHGVKNQLLSSEILINSLKELDAVRGDEETRAKMEQLSEINSFMLQRLNVLYRSFIKINTVFKVVSSKELAELVREKLGPGLDFISYTVEDVKLLCDIELLSEALYNIIRNAVEATEKLDERSVDVTIRNLRAKVLITIKDNGKGIAKKERKNIFNPFFSTKNSQTNWGLGLSYANMVIRKHRGTIQFETTEGKGTVFLIDLPRLEVR